MEKSKRRLCEYSKNEILEDVQIQMDIKDPTVDDVLTHLLGDYDGWKTSNYVIHRYETETPRTFLQRFNTIWVYPLFLISVPFQWLYKGSIGVSRNSKIGAIIHKLVKFDN